MEKMENKLKLEHLAPHVPFRVKGISLLGTISTITGFNDRNSIVTHGDYSIGGFDTIKLLLFPIDSLTKEIEVNGGKFVPIEWFEEKYYTLDLHKQCLRLLEEDGENWINQSDYMLVEQLLEWKFDIFGLIEKGLAIAVTEEFNPYK